MNGDLITYGSFYGATPSWSRDYETKKGGVKKYNRKKAFNGYTLFCRNCGSAFYLVDMEGKVVHKWDIENSSIHFGELTPAGRLLYSTADRSIEKGRGIYELDWNGNQVWHYGCPVDHDHALLENGNILILCREEIVDARVRTPIWPDFSAAFSPYMAEVTRTKAVEWEWHACEHLEELEKLAGLKFPLEGAELDRDRDWAHCNTCSPLPENRSGASDPRFRKNNILFSYREMDTIGVIDRETDKIVWTWGPGEIIGQHKPVMLENGNILLFDNGVHSNERKRSYSRILEVDPIKEKIAWHYESSPPEDFYSPYVSNQQKLPNGNVLICSGSQGRIFEVTEDREIVWEYENPFCSEKGSNGLYRHSGRYSPAFIEPLLK